MPSLIHELDNEALLLLYLAGELEAEDRAEVEQMLSTDAGLRASLAAVGRDVVVGEAAVAAADHVDPPAASPSAASVALRRVDRALRQWAVDRQARDRLVLPVGRQPRFPAWAYPTAAAAAVVIGAVGWWGLQPDSSDRGPGLPTAGRLGHRGDGDRPDGGFSATAARIPMLADADGGGGTSDATDLADADRQARALARADDLSTAAAATAADAVTPVPTPILRDGQPE